MGTRLTAPTRRQCQDSIPARPELPLPLQKPENRNPMAAQPQPCASFLPFLPSFAQVQA